MELINKIKIPKTPKKINILLTGGGGVGGSYGLGILRFIKKLEEQKIVEVVSISGASVGSLLGCYYLDNKLDDFEKLMTNSVKYFKKHKNNNNLKNIIFNDLKNINIKNINKKLFVSYQSVKSGKKTISIFKDNNHLNEIVYTSCFIPYFFEDKPFNNNNGDCGWPHLFIENYNNNYNSLYISLECKQYFGSRTITSLKSQINKGLFDAYLFFKHNKCKNMCYISSWTSKDFLIYRLKELLMTVVVLFVYFYEVCLKHITPGCLNTFIKYIYLDCIYLAAFS